MIKQLGIEKIRIDLPFRLDHVNCFLAEGKNGYIVIDTGLNDQRAQAMWKEKLQNKEIKQMLITHLHPDHSGYAGILQKKTGATLSMSKTDADALIDMWSEDSIPKLQRDYQGAAVPERLAHSIIEMTRIFRSKVTPIPQVDHYVEEGELIQIGNEEYEVIFTPGHSAGLICLYQREKSVLLSTDHILPKITPNIAYWFYGEQNPLQSYEDSLQKIKRLEVDYVIPSHGEPFYNANQRIDEIWQHHLARFDETLDAIKDGSTVFNVCEKLFTRQMDMHDYQFAIGETIAHLEYLRLKGECKREMYEGEWIYQSP